MNKKKAIKILEEQKQKILSSEYPNNEEWTFETASYIKDFFGFDSTEYSWIAQFKWHVTYIEHPFIDNEDEVNRELRQKPKKAIQFLDNCKKIIENKGLYKPKKKNWISDKGNDFLITTSIGLIVFGFGIGHWAKEFEVFSTFFNKKQEKSISTVVFDSTDNISNKKTNVGDSDKTNNKSNK